MTTYSEFTDSVREMRSAQIKFFATKDQYWLKKSKSFEKQVDDYLSNQMKLEL